MVANATRIKIDLASGIIEAEGEESFVREMADRYWSSVPITPMPAPEDNGGVKTTMRPISKKQKSDQAPKNAKPSGSVEDETVKASLKPHLTALDAYVKARNPKSQFDEAVTIASFMATQMNEPVLTHAGLFTALRLLGRKLPGKPGQVLIDAKNKKGYFYEVGDGYSLTPKGMNRAEHELTAPAE